MAEERKALNGHYLIKFQCPNCGEIFLKDIQKGVKAEARGGTCPNCGCRDNDPSSGVGMFKVVRKNEPKYDARQVLMEMPPPGFR